MNKKLDDIKKLAAPYIQKAQPVFKIVLSTLKRLNYEWVYRLIVVVLLMSILSVLNKVYNYGNSDISSDVYEIKSLIQDMSFRR